MVSVALRAVLERGDGVGELVGEHVGNGFAEHAICGDRVQLSVRATAGIVQAVRWRANGCPASMAVAALASDVLVNVAVADMASTLQAAIASCGGLARHERHAEAMVLRALHDALGG